MHERIDDGGSVPGPGLHVDGAAGYGGVFVQPDVRCRLDQSHLWESAVGDVGKILGNRRQLLRKLVEDLVLKGKHVDVAKLEQTRRAAASARTRVNVDLPGDPVFLEKLEYGFVGKGRAAGDEQRIGVTMGSCRQQKHAVGTGEAHQRRKPAVRGGEAGSYEVVIVEVISVVEPHGP